MGIRDVRLTVHVDPDDLIGGMDRDDVIGLIVAIDKRAQDWDFTLELAAHFEALHREYHAEAKKHGDDDSGCDVCKVAK